MKRLACLVILAASTLPSMASVPEVSGACERPKPKADGGGAVIGGNAGFAVLNIFPKPLLLDDITLKSVLSPVDMYLEQVSTRIRWYRLSLKNGGQGRPRGPYW